MRLGFSDIVEHFLSGGRLAGLLGPGSGVESGGLSLQGEAGLCTELAEGSLGLAVLGQREPPLLTHLLNSTDQVFLAPAVRHFHNTPCDVRGDVLYKGVKRRHRERRNFIIMIFMCVCATIWSVVEVHSQQTFPYVSFGSMGPALADHSYVDLSTVGTVDDNAVVCHTDLSTCCSGSQGFHRGNWYFPNGTRLPLAGVIYLGRTDQIAVIRRTTATGPTGIYRCDIQTVAVHSNTDISVGETLYVGLYLADGGIYFLFPPSYSVLRNSVCRSYNYTWEFDETNGL